MAFFGMPSACPMYWVTAVRMTSTVFVTAGVFEYVGAPGGFTLDLWEKSEKGEFL